MRHQVTFKRIENYNIEVDYDTESSKVWVVINYKSRKSLQRHEKEFEGKGAIKQAQEYLELFLGVIKDKKELENPIDKNKILANALANASSRVNRIKTIMAVGVNTDELKIHIVMQDKNNEIIQLMLANHEATSLAARLEHQLRVLDTKVYISREQKEEVTT